MDLGHSSRETQAPGPVTPHPAEKRAPWCHSPRHPSKPRPPVPELMTGRGRYAPAWGITRVPRSWRSTPCHPHEPSLGSEMLQSIILSITQRPNISSLREPHCPSVPRSNTDAPLTPPSVPTSRGSSGWEQGLAWVLGPWASARPQGKALGPCTTRPVGLADATTCKLGHPGSRSPKLSYVLARVSR